MEEIDHITEDDSPIGEMDTMIEGEVKKEEEEEIDMREEEEEKVVEAKSGTIGEEVNMDIIRKRNEVEAENAENVMSTRTKVSVHMKREQEINVSLFIRKKERVILTAGDPLMEER